ALAGPAAGRRLPGGRQPDPGGAPAARRALLAGAPRTSLPAGDRRRRRPRAGVPGLRPGHRRGRCGGPGAGAQHAGVRPAGGGHRARPGVAGLPDPAPSLADGAPYRGVVVMKYFSGPAALVVPRALIVVHDLLMVCFVWIGLRWLASVAGAPPASSLLLELLVAVLVQGVTLQLVGLYQGLWRFASLPDLANLVRGALIGVLLIVAALFLLGRLPEVPRRV